MELNYAFITACISSLLVLFALGTYFSAAEMAFSSLSPARLSGLTEAAGKKGRRARLVAGLHGTRFDEVISTLLICNNFVAITAATVSAALFVHLVPEYGYIISTFAVASIVIVFTDIIPKSTSKQQPERVAMFCVPFLLVLIAFFKPVNYLIIKFKNRLSDVFKSTEEETEQEAHTLLGQELTYMVEEAEKKGTLNEDDSTLITNAITFNDVTAWDIITPRVNIKSIPQNANTEEIAEIFLDCGYSRMPVVGESLDEIRGIVHLRDFLKCMASGTAAKPVTLADIITPAVFTVTSAPITDVLTLLKKEKSHMAIVADEYGGTEGLVTMEDILEQLVGDIFDENDEIVEEFTPLGDGKHKVLCSAPIIKMFEYFDITAESTSNTVCGWIMDELRRIPEQGDEFAFENLTVKITKTDGTRAVECIMQETPEENPQRNPNETDEPQ